MNTVNDFLIDRLKNRRRHELSIEDQLIITGGDISRFIVSRLISGKYRKNKLDEITRANIEKKVQIQVKNNEPIRLTFPFGGYKNYKLPSYPLCDWAEFFMMSYYADYMNQIAEFYEPGVILEFCSDEVALEKIDNVPADKTEQYTKSFQDLLKLFANNLPTNIELKLVRVRDLYASESELWEELKICMEKTKDNWEGFDNEKKAGRISMFKLNYIFPDKKGWDAMNDQERNIMMKENTAFHDAYLSLSKRKELVRGDTKIVIFPMPINDSISVGSTRYSVAKFWSGFGSLKSVGAGFQDLVLSPDKLLLENFDRIETDLPDIKLSGFENIRVYRG